MKHRRYDAAVAAFVLAASALGGHTLAAQSTAQGAGRQVAADDTPTVASRDVARESTPEAGHVLSRRVTVHLESMPLKRAIDAVAASASVRASYNVALINASTRSVTVHMQDQTLAAVFGRVLAGTSLKATGLPGGQIAIVRDELAAAEQGVVVGKIVHAKTREPIAGVSVSLDDATKGVVTASDGTFRIPADVGSHTVKVRIVGFVRQAKPVTVSEGQTAMVEFALEPSASVLDEVVVTGTVVGTERKAVTTPITVITGEDLEKRNITRLEQLFRGEVPGVVALDMGTTNYSTGLANAQSSLVFARGSSSVINQTPTPLKTYVDGVELLDPSYLGTIDPRSIERIEIVTGPQAATIYGSGAMGGVMQIFTKKGSRSGRPEMTLNLRYGMLQSSLNNSYTPAHTHALLVNGGNGADFNYSVTGSYGYQGQWQPGLWMRSTGLSAGMTHTRGMVQVGASAGITAIQNGSYGSGTGSVCVILNQVCYSTLLSRTLREIGELPPAAGASGFFDSNVARSFTQNVALNVDIRPSSIWQHSLLVGRVTNNFKTDPERPTFRTAADSLYMKQWREGGRLTANYNTTVMPRFGPVAFTLTLGGSLSSGDQNDYTGCTKVPDGVDYVACDQYSSPGVWSRPTIDDKSWGGFGLFRMGFFDRLYVSLGLRGERNPTYGSDHPVDWTPTQGIAYTIEAGEMTLKLLASYGSATRSPQRDQREALYNMNTSRTPATALVLFANPNLTPEHSRGPEGGFELSYGNWGAVTLNRYDQRVSDLIMRIPVDSIEVMYSYSTTPSWMPQMQWQNLATVRQHGWETTGSLNLGPINVKGTYSMADARTIKLTPRSDMNGYTVYGIGEARDGIPSHTGYFTVSYARGATSVSWTGNYVGSVVQNQTSIWEYVNQLTRMPAYKVRALYWDQKGTTPGYLKSDVAASHRLSNRTSLLLNVQNLSDSHGSELSELFPSLGRQTQLGVSIRFL